MRDEVTLGPSGPARAWFSRRTSHWRDWPAPALLSAKRSRGTRISVVIPARDEEPTVGGVVSAVRRALMDQVPLVDELVVMDSDSADATAAVAARAGAVVHRCRDVGPALGTYPGKGEALWKSLLVTSGDILVFLDADLTRWGTHFVTGLLGPLLTDQEVHLVKGCYDRLRGADATDGSGAGGGRVTELMARPLLNLHVPELAGFAQPLAGETAARRALLEAVPFPVGYGVEIATLLDALAVCGLDGLAECHLGTRQNRHQRLQDLSVMALEVLAAAECRADVDLRGHGEGVRGQCEQPP